MHTSLHIVRQNFIRNFKLTQNNTLAIGIFQQNIPILKHNFSEQWRKIMFLFRIKRFFPTLNVCYFHFSYVNGIELNENT